MFLFLTTFQGRYEEAEPLFKKALKDVLGLHLISPTPNQDNDITDDNPSISQQELPSKPQQRAIIQDEDIQIYLNPSPNNNNDNNNNNNTNNTNHIISPRFSEILAEEPSGNSQQKKKQNDIIQSKTSLIAPTINNLALLYHNMGRWKEAEE